MNFFKKLFSKKHSCHNCCANCHCHSNLLSDSEHEILQQIDDKIVIGKIHQITAHPDPKVTKVRVTQTEVAPGQIEQILCGGVNIAEGAYVAVATIGAKLSPDFEISERKIRGELSRGMICSRTELGLPADGEVEHGIWLLGEKFAPHLGTPLKNIK